MKHVPRSLVHSAPVAFAAGLVLFAFAFLLVTGDYQDDGVVGWAVQSVAASSRTVWSCTDSDDGQNYETKGKITFVRKKLDGQRYERVVWDKCYNSRYVVEYYCAGSNFGSRRQECKLGCSDGACR